MVKMMMTRMKKKTVIVAWLFSPFEWLHSAWVCVFCVWVSIRTFESILRSGFVWVNLVLLVGLFVCLQMEKEEEQNWTNEDNLKKFFSFVFVLLAGRIMIVIACGPANREQSLSNWFSRINCLAPLRSRWFCWSLASSPIWLSHPFPWCPCLRSPRHRCLVSPAKNEFGKVRIVSELLRRKLHVLSTINKQKQKSWYKSFLRQGSPFRWFHQLIAKFPVSPCSRANGFGYGHRVSAV